MVGVDEELDGWGRAFYIALPLEGFRSGFRVIQYRLTMNEGRE